MTMQQLTILHVILPLLAAPILLLVNRERVAFWITMAVSLAVLAFVVLLLIEVSVNGPISYYLGGWKPPVGIEYRIDLLSAFMLLIVAAIGTITLPYAAVNQTNELESGSYVKFYIAWLLCFGALLGLASSGDIFNIFVFLEISALASYILIAMGRDKRALLASFQYLVLGTIGATFFLIGIGLVYAQTGTLNLIDLSTRVEDLKDSPTLLTGFCFLAVGVLLKLAAFPLHGWLPDAYTHAPSVVSAFLAGTATKIALYLLIRLIHSVFGVEFVFSALPLDELIIILGLCGIFLGSIKAIFESNIKRMFAYSSVAQIGYLLIGVGLLSASGLTATLIHVFNHALMKSAVFLALGAVIYRTGLVNIKDLAGLGPRMPLTMATIVIAGFSLIGLPGTSGFISKWYLVSAVLEQDRWMLAIMILVGSLLAAVYVFRLIEAAWFNEPKHDVKEAPLTLLVPICLLAFANIYFGFDTRLSVDVSSAISQLIFLEQSR
jgi:multicomponent Na+:H+ antiporter subunit D